MRTQTQEEFIQILRFEICGTPLPQGFSVTDEEALVQLAKKHDLTHLIYDALTKNGLPCTSQFAMQQYFAAIWRAEQMSHELLDMAELFEKEGIDFIPLKGSVMRLMYPESWMRTSADIDVLVKPEYQLLARDLLVKKLGYSFDPNEDLSHHIGMTAPKNGVNVELHKTLFTDYQIGKAVRDPVSDIWNNNVILKKGHMHWYELSDPVFYYYHLAHMAKHLKQSGGCPVRGLIDLWILDRRPQQDKTKCITLLKQSGLGVFHQQMVSIANNWLGTYTKEKTTFNGVEYPPVLSEELEQYILTGSLYGDMGRRTSNSIQESSTLKYIMHRLFPPTNYLKTSYPVLESHPWLTPFCYILRLTNVFKKDFRKNMKNQTQVLIKSSDTDIEQASKISSILNIQNILD